MIPSVTKDGRHKFKWLTYDGHKVRIDEDIAPLLSKLWKLGIRTGGSCHGHCSFVCNHKWKTIKYKNGGSYSYHNKTKDCYNNIWLIFESVQDLEDLINIVAEYSELDGTMYHLMNCDRAMQVTGEKKYPKDAWAYAFLMRNFGVTGHWGRPTFNGKRSTQEMWIDDGCEKNDFIIQPQLTFPRKHLVYVEEKITQALRDRKKK